ncbi:MAG TPA: hypothetical protein VGN08_12345 [Solirubrobacteraceae bacterium]
MPAIYRIEVMPDPPRLFERGEDVPQEGWAIESDTWIYENGKRVGVHPHWESQAEGGFRLRYEVLPD